MYIIATVGPSTKDKNVLREMIKSGANVLRLNFSHGNYDEFEKTIIWAKLIDEKIHILQDLSGRKIRVSKNLNYVIKIYNGEEVLFCGDDIYKKSEKSKYKVIPLNINNKDLTTNYADEITMKDNTMKFKVLDITADGIITRSIKGGIVRAEKGCNISGFIRKNTELSLKDKLDLDWGIKNKVDIITQSFVEEKDDILKIKEYISGEDFNPKIWAKVETPRGINNIKEILSGCDGVIIGRGDLIPESSIEDIPIYENIVMENSRGKNIIIGTHILNSMKCGKGPLLPEVESIYYHIKKGVSGFLLAGETSVGKVPITTVKFLSNIIYKYKGINSNE